MKAEIISRYEDLVQCSICKFFIKKSQWKWHKQDHKYDHDGRDA